MAAGCATTYRVEVSALAQPASSAAITRTYTFASGQPRKHHPTDLEFQEVLRYVRPALMRNGWQEAPMPADAAVEVFVDFGVGNPVTHTYTSSTPVYAELGGSYSTRTTTTKNASGQATTTTETVRVPGRYERVGSDVTVNSVTTYRKYLRLSARLRPSPGTSGQTREIWSVTATVDDPQTDLRAALPLLAEALIPYVGRDTHQAIVVKFREVDGRLELVPAK